jgi:hypothetical protein
LIDALLSEDDSAAMTRVGAAWSEQEALAAARDALGLVPACDGPPQVASVAAEDAGDTATVTRQASAGQLRTPRAGAPYNRSALPR